MSSTVVEGIGIHSGERCRVELHRSEGPLRFRQGRHEVVADATAVAGTPRCTVLGADGVRVAMVEHLLATLRVAGFWHGVLVAVEGSELPILDGSAGPWREAVAALGPPPPAPGPWRPNGPVRFRHGASRLLLEPGPEHLQASIDFDHPAIGRQRWAGGPACYDGLLDARTFATAAEVWALQAAGGLRGAAQGRGIVFDDDGPSTPLRWPDEPVRHKALDALGDLTLLGRPLAGSLSIERGSHAAHVAFMLQLRIHTPCSQVEPPA